MHNYEKKLQNGLADIIAAHTKPGTVNSMKIEHDDWCCIFRGGECDCDPTFRVKLDVTASELATDMQASDKAFRETVRKKRV